MSRRLLARTIASALAAFRRYARGRGCLEVVTSQLAPFPTEDPAHAFHVDYMGRPAYLVQSGRRYHRLLLSAFPNVFEVRPAFWAVPADDGSALTQVTVLETAESSTCSTVTDPADLVIGTVAAIVRAVGDALSSEDISVDFPRLGRDLTVGHRHWVLRRDVQRLPAPFPAYAGHNVVLEHRSRSIASGLRWDSPRDGVGALKSLGADEATEEAFVEGERLAPPVHLTTTVALEPLLSALLDWPDLRGLALFPRDASIVTP